MTDHEKDKIRTLRQKGASYAAIAQHLGYSVNTIKSFCRRDAVLEESPIPEEEVRPFCKRCGKPVQSIPGKRRRVFCSDACRYAYAYEAAHKQSKTSICAYCGHQFYHAQSAQRKYCCHPCFVRARQDGETRQ